MRTNDNVIEKNYVVGGLIGAGGMGVVYRATQLALEREVAIKVVRPELRGNELVRERFRHEAIAAARVAHRNVIQIVDYREPQGSPCLVMSHVPGRRLGEAFHEGPWTLHRVRAVVDQLLAALAATHARGIVHGDVKSDNVLLSRDGSDEHATLIDFGLARLPDHPRTAEVPAAVSGTPEYLAPEVIGGEPPTPAADLYGAGVILYELIAGTTPFGGANAATILARQVDDPVPSLIERCPKRSVPPGLEKLVMRALDKDPRTRIGTATLFREALAALPLLAEPPVNDEPFVFDPDGDTLQLQPQADTDPARDALQHAIRHGDADGIVVAALALVQQLVEAHRLAAAIDTLEDVLRKIGGSSADARVAWRVELSLAALYDGIGDRRHALALARSGHTHADVARCTIGLARARALVDRLARRSTRGALAR